MNIVPWRSGIATQKTEVISSGPLRLLLLGLAFLLLLLVTARAQEYKQEVPDNVAAHAAPPQPLPYSHKTHLNLGLACLGCHTNAAAGQMMTFPSTAKCMQCHNSAVKDKPAIQQLATFAKSGRPIPWVRVYELTPGVNWSHRKHLVAGMQCVMCHGDVAQMEAMSKKTGVTAMASCISCHQAHNAPVVCQTCHSWPAPK